MTQNRINSYGPGTPQNNSLAPRPFSSERTTSELSYNYNFGQIVYSKASQEWVIYRGNNTWDSFAGSTGQVSSLTGDDSVQVFPQSGNINVLGKPDLIFNGNNSTATLKGTNLTKPTKYVVGKSSSQYRFTSVQAAINQAAADGASSSAPAVVLVTPGTYTESLSLVDYVFLTGIGNASNVQIVGNAVYSGAYSWGAENIGFTSSNSAAALSLQSTASVIVSLRICDFNAGTSGIAFECTGSGVTATLFSSKLNAATGTKCKNISAGSVEFFASSSAFTDTASTISGGFLQINSSDIQDSFTLSGTAQVNILNSELYSASLSCFNIGSSATVIAYAAIINSNASSNYYVTGTGNFLYTSIVTGGSATLANSTVTLSGLALDVGNLTFDGGVTHIESDGQLWIGSTALGRPVVNTLTAGSGVNITNAGGSITISATTFSSLSPAAAATTATLNATYNNGTAGVGATLTNAGSQAAFAVDGYSASLNDRILVKNQSAPADNGVYSVTTVGDGSHNWVLTRTSDYDTTAQIFPGNFILVVNGSTQANTAWVQYQTVATIGTSAINFAEFGISISYPITIAQGGTNATSMAHTDGITYFDGTRIVTASALTNGQLLIGSTSAAPVAATITAGTGITVTNGAGSIQIASSTAPPTGSVVQYKYTQTNAATTPTAIIPVRIGDGTYTPLATDGSQLFTITITPQSASNVLVFKASINFTWGNTEPVVLLTQTGVTDALACNSILIPVNTSASFYVTLFIDFIMIAGSTSPLTFNINVGDIQGRQIGINSATNNGAVNAFGGAGYSNFQIMEIST